MANTRVDMVNNNPFYVFMAHQKAKQNITQTSKYRYRIKKPIAGGYG